MYRILGLFISLFFLVSCETTNSNFELFPEPQKETIYNPQEEVLDQEEEQIIKKDFSGIKNYHSKKIDSLITTYGNFDFSKKEELFELHRYNAGECRIFIQNYTKDKIIIEITIFHLDKKIIYESFKQDNC